ncbi:nucleotidyltransferase [Desertibacillus haloalkaliphilus]|uniref:nucleotidyltransferase n=1 Tax=Desertibacillus haloalkaliphilus TaxID=1328930 RepID=UPI001C267CB3|nr:nucleotidyltransferase [Desertibacillus haloalkaliphilus]MBU8907129.1 nucleotidyltransferase [Desertibacillus haloalkaliphilus]
MKSAGVIVEYNPFHNGHYYHLQQTKKVTGADIIIAVMSGYFLQRGEPALVSKWQRTKMALQGGADLVIELPYVYSTQKAEQFASGAVSILGALGTDAICFGSESGDIRQFHQLVSFMDEHKQSYEYYVQYYIKEGNSYPKAAALAFQAITQSDELLDLSQPNNILGYHYIKAIRDQRLSIKAHTIARHTAGYHDKEVTDEKIASATSIRNQLHDQGKIATIEGVIPPFTKEHLVDYKNTYGNFHAWEDYFQFLKYRLLTMTSQQIHLIYEAEEGLENRVKQMISTSDSFSSFMKAIKTKRYTWNRLQRLCLHILTNTTKEDMQQAVSFPQAPYLRLLGMSDVGQTYLRSIKKQLDTPIVSTVSQHHHPMLTIDQKAASIYSLALSQKQQQYLHKQEYATPPIRYNKNTGAFK